VARVKGSTTQVMSAHLVFPEKARVYPATDEHVASIANAIPARRERVAMWGWLGMVVVAAVLGSGAYFVFAYLW